MDGRPRCVDVVTLPYPGFPTDLQPMAVALAAVSTGTALLTENVFEGRFMFVNELVRLGASRAHRRAPRVVGAGNGSPVRRWWPPDIRAGAGLVLAGLLSRRGDRGAGRAPRSDRGYPDIVEHAAAAWARDRRVERPR
jgi:UDP-N-acetylglucosamine 1-carboxyvinyltransferase